MTPLRVSSSIKRRRLIASLALALAATPVQAAGPTSVDGDVRATIEGGVTASVDVSPILLSLDLSATSVQVGQTVTAEVTTRNVGKMTLKSIVVALRFEPSGLTPRGPTTTRLTQLKSGRTVEASFKLCAAAVGTYLIFAQAQVDVVTIDSPARPLLVTASRRTAC